MEHRSLGKSNIEVEPVIVGTWAFGGGSWWGPQDDNSSVSVMEEAISKGVNAFDTAPMYGRGRSESIIGDFIKKRKCREKIIFATKLGLSWDGSKVYHDLSKNRMLEELDESRTRLKTDYLDLYQIHWPDPDIEIERIAETMFEFYNKGIIKAIGVSNCSIEQMSRFLKIAPLHSLQPQYSMFERSIDKDVVGFCKGNGIALITYAPLYAGVLTGKFFFDNKEIPEDINRKMKKKDLIGPRYSINKKALSEIRSIGVKYKKTLAQIAINWNFSQPGITSAIVGMRNLIQTKENLGSLDFGLTQEDIRNINKILTERENEINGLNDIV